MDTGLPVILSIIGTTNCFDELFYMGYLNGNIATSGGQNCYCSVPKSVLGDFKHIRKPFNYGLWSVSCYCMVLKRNLFYEPISMFIQYSFIKEVNCLPVVDNCSQALNIG